MRPLFGQNRRIIPAYYCIPFFEHGKKAKSMLSFLNESTVDSDEEGKQEKIEDLKYYPSDVDEDEEQKKLTCDILFDEIEKMQKELPSFDQATRRRLSEVSVEVNLH